MRRRTYLAACAGTLAATAGCNASEPGTGTSRRTTTETADGTSTTTDTPTATGPPTTDCRSTTAAGNVVATGGLHLDNRSDSARTVSVVVVRRGCVEDPDRDVHSLTTSEPGPGDETLLDLTTTVAAGDGRYAEADFPLYDRLTEYRVFATTDGGSAALEFGAEGSDDYGYLMVEVTEDGGVELDLAVP